MWVLPTGHSDPDGKWDTEAKAYDNDLETGASCYQFDSFLELILLKPILCDKVRVYVDDMLTIDIDVWNGSSWVDVYAGSIDFLEWVEKSIPGGEINVSKARVACTYDFLGALYEFQFQARKGFVG